MLDFLFTCFVVLGKLKANVSLLLIRDLKLGRKIVVYCLLELLLVLCISSGFTASTISFPLEVARKRLMVGTLQGRCPTHMAAALSEVIREEGLLGLYRGWGASCLKVMPSSGITWMFYEAWKDILLVDRPLL